MRAILADLVAHTMGQVSIEARLAALRVERVPSTVTP
jgi:hypothetical protein